MSIEDFSFDKDKAVAEVISKVVSEDEFLTVVTGVKTASPYTVNGVTMVQAHVSPLENIRVAGAPRVDIQFTLSEDDTGVPYE